MKLFLKLLIRNVKKNSFFSFVNILGLAIGFSGFILSYQYINKELSYDRWNPHYKDIYLVGLHYQGEYTDQTPPSLSAFLKEFPEVVMAGRKYTLEFMGYPMFGDQAVNVKDAVLLDSAAAQIFKVTPIQGKLYKTSEQKEASLISKKLFRQLFPKDSLQSFDTPKNIPVLTGSFSETIYGICQKRDLSLLDQDLIFIKNIEDETSGNPYTYQTYIQVKPGTDLRLLEQKITSIYQDKISKHEGVYTSSFAKGSIYLDPFSHLHLQPRHGSNAGYITIWLLGSFSLIILALSASNFSNLILAQSQQRNKEIAIKKIFGNRHSKITLQFIAEVFMQCILAALLAWLLLFISSPALQKWINEDVKIYLMQPSIFYQILFAVLMTTLLASIYPSIQISGSKLSSMIKNETTLSVKRSFFSSSLLTFQLVIAIVFITGSILVRQQMNYIQQSDKGFDPSQIIVFKGIGMYYDMALDGAYYDFKQRLIQDPNIQIVAAASNIPGETTPPPKKQFNYVDKVVEAEHVVIDIEYFETLNIASLQGEKRINLQRLLTDSSTNFAVINEAMVAKLGVQNPIGSKISGCDREFVIIDVVGNSKAQGFENLVVPTVYTYRDECGPARYKTTLMVKTESGKIREAIEAVQKEWDNNPHMQSFPLDYQFMDREYAKLSEKRAQQGKILNGFTFLATFIALLGLASMSAYYISIRSKEVSIRKVMGASVTQLFMELNKSFVKIFILAILIAIPLAYLLLSMWLMNFAYAIKVSPLSFVYSILFTALILFVAVSFQSIKAAKANPVDSLRDE